METDSENPKLIWRLRVPSKSTPGTFHIVEIYDSGDMRCDCVANQMAKVCSHIKEAFAYIKTLVAKMEKLYGELQQNNNQNSKEREPVSSDR